MDGRGPPEVEQNIVGVFLAKLSFTPTPNRWESSLALSVGGGLEDGPMFAAAIVPYPPPVGLAALQKGTAFSVTHEF